MSAMKFLLNKTERRLRMFNNNRGDIGIKQIAITVAVIVIIGVAVNIITGSMLQTWIGDVWKMLMDFIKEKIGGGGGTGTP
ncbi:MAG: hypothetical protein N2645_15005 [Clostridia bacterium]|nr:hypothetical protein [Clostridia bacterium]